MSKLISDVTLAILALVCISSCNRERVVRDNIVQLTSRPVTLSCNSMRLIACENMIDTIPKQFYWVVYSDSVDCSTCRLTNLLQWGDFIHKVKNGTDNVGFRFIFSPSIIRKTKCSGISEQNVPFLKTKRTSVNLFPSPSTK